MATWDGSYPCEDPNYFLYADQNNTPSTPKNWTFFPGNESNTFYHDNRNIYPSTEPIVFEQNMPAVYYQMRADVPSGPSVTSELGPLSNVCQEALPRADINVNASNDLQCFPPNVRPRSQYFQYNNTQYGKKEKGFKPPKTFPFQSNAEHIVPTLVEQSRLHATANEFIPNNSKSKPDGTELQYGHSSVSEGSFGVHIDDSGSNARSSTVNFSDNKSRYDKKNLAYKQRDMQNHMFFRGTMHKNSFRVQNAKECNRMQNDEYYANKHHLNKSYGDTQGGRKRMNRDVATFQTSSSSHEFSKDGGLLNAHSTIEESKRQTCDGTYENNGSTRNGIHRMDKARKFNVQRNDGNYFKYNSNNEQSQVPRRGMRKNVVNNKMDKYDKDYKEKRKETSNSKFSYDKQAKPDRMKDKSKSKDITPDMKDRDNFSWRRKAESNDKGGMLRQSKKNEIDDDASQRERLTEQLNRGQLECLVCCEYIKQIDYIWSCSNCYHVLHLDCIKKWAKSSHSENGWRCPACQNVSSFIPEKYFCFCGKTRSPEWNRRDVAHSCGEICGRSRKTNCVHKCTLLCHPGSCPVCTAMVTKFCGCTRSSQTLQCSDLTLLHCDAVCAKTLNCEKHSCENKCHHGDCGSCDKKLEQECYCGKEKREITCQPNVSLKYSCNNTCDKLLDCGNHRCQKICHLDSCDPCSLTPEKVTTCCCGQSPLTEKRNSCLDAISTCDKICSKRLACGQPNNPHTCKVVCHTGDCPDCEFTTDVKCRCGNMDREIACKELTTKADDARCEKKCTKKRSCGKHKCNQLCCIDIEHICPLPCLKTLSCGRHKCEQSCHKGRCLPCWRSSFEELYCECGAAVTYPPVPCGTRRPVCNQPCSREHVCGHEVLHNCHSDSTCPPCTVLTQKWCYGKHELRRAVPCYVNEISCGLPCSKPLSCGRHKCITICHPGPCEKPGQICVQPCVIPRELCGHICAAPCHEGECPDAPCKEMVKVTCQCGHRSMTRACAENSREYQRIASSILASKMADMQLGHSVDLEEVFGQGAKKQNQLKTLECNDECKLIERNRRLALGLQIVNPDLSGKLMPRYSEFMKHWAKKDAHFCQMVHEKLTELVQLAKTSKQKSRSYSFDSMNRDKRHFVHESCEHFGCESQAYDLEPKRNVVATAVKDKCWLPSYSLLEIVQRENGQRKVPGPMLNPSKGNSTIKTVLSLPIKKNQKITAVPITSRSPEPEIDYFDYQG